MTILAVADVESRYLYDYYQPGRLDNIDLIIACGDLRREYLEFLVTLSHCPVYYVHGNHDDSYDTQPPEGCECIDGRLVKYKGLRIVGLGGSYRYKDGTHMFTEAQMQRRILRLLPTIFRHRGFDILVTHAPARHVNDWNTPSHMGFECFVRLIDHYKPKFFLHGHIHKNYGIKIPQKMMRGETVVINAYEYCRVEM